MFLGFSKLPLALDTVKEKMLSVDTDLDTSNGVGIFFDDPREVEHGTAAGSHDLY